MGDSETCSGLAHCPVGRRKQKTSPSVCSLFIFRDVTTPCDYHVKTMKDHVHIVKLRVRRARLESHDAT